MHSSIAQLFADWSEPAVLCQISTTYNPAAGVTTESAIETNLRVIATEALIAPAPNTAAQLPRATTTFHIRPAELPTDINWSHIRIRFNNQTYQIVDRTVATGDLLVSLHGFRVEQSG
jgi:hypothetical protein